jgi:penicillin-binding protein 1B
VYRKPSWGKLIRDDKGNIVHTSQPVTRQALDPRIAYLMIDLMQEVVRSGTAAGVRARGFDLPAAGKTGTSHDGWFAGFTSRLICIVWVGFDDNQELFIEGARSALPIWTEFMKRAHRHRQYRNVAEFEPPDGVVLVRVDPATGALATSGCPGALVEAFLAGTQPVEVCRVHGGTLASATQVSGWETDGEAPSEARSATAGTEARPAAAPPGRRRVAQAAAKPAETPPPAPRKSVFRRLLDMFK